MLAPSHRPLPRPSLGWGYLLPQVVAEVKGYVCVWGSFVIRFRCLGCLWVLFRRPESIFGGYWVTLLIPDGSLWEFKLLSGAFLKAFLRSQRARVESRGNESTILCES